LTRLLSLIRRLHAGAIIMTNAVEIKYEDLCSDSLDTFRTVTGFFELKRTAEFERDRAT